MRVPHYTERTINEKISFRGEALHRLTWAAYNQLRELNKMILAPYYKQLLILQGKEVADAETFKSTFGKNRYEYENGI